MKDIPVPKLCYGMAIDKVSNCKYLGKLIDDDDMDRQRKQVCSGHINRQNVPVQIVLLLLVHKCVNYGAITALNGCENYVLHTQCS